MPLPAMLAGLGPLLSQGAGYAGSALGSNVGQQILGNLGTGLAGMGFQKMFGGGTGPSPEDQQARSGYLQQLQQPNQFDFEPIRQEEIRRFREELLPMIGEEYAGIRSGAPNLRKERATTDLSARLASLQQQFGLQNAGLEQNRMGMLGNYLQGQQNYGLNRASNRQNAYQFGNNQQSEQLQQLINMLSNVRNPLERTTHSRQPGTAENIVQGVKPMIPTIAGGIAGGVAGGPAGIIPGAAAGAGIKL